ncbi:dipeptide/oligopeptide/nickel ABC transporter permease/ATP-binding protein [Streptomyces sp. RTd22]|uniref:dipeptide/oligopeptide/nickel ABC transporter permease/ATP-binding protein n=1 Tax=Streptomyces sp. RTd22 TaxID=1841249 RepID=UPI000B103BE1|nr:dipeptide/oligopeptide/nickel ABC transporter permease/ATP-binding protein [Streptomyces sp. RTd22]
MSVGVNTETVAAAGPGRHRRPGDKSTGRARGVLRRPGTWLSLAWITVVVLGSLFASLLAPHDPLDQDLRRIYQGPSGTYWLGTDSLGRDVLSRLMHGGALSLLGSGEAVLVALFIGIPFGLLAGYRGGWADAVISRIAEALMALPVIIILLAVVAVYGRGFAVSMGALGVIFSAAIIRLVRATTAAVRSELYVDAARVSGLRAPRIVVRHVLPNVIAPVLIQSSLTLGTALLIQSGLGFLGLGPQPPAPNWGAGIAEAATAINQDAWLMVPTGGVLVLTVLAFNFLGDALRDAAPAGRGAAATGRFFGHSALPADSDAAEPADDGVLLRVRGLVVSFPEDGGGDQPVVDGVGFDVRPGETVGLVGESGCGKTVTALSVLGLVPGAGHVAEGRILFDGADLARMPEKRLAAYRGKRIGYIAQEPMTALDPCFTIGSQLVEPLRRHRGLDRARARARAVELLGLVGIPRPEQICRAYPHQLSGGMAQRAAIALALTGEPDLLIADEPTTALDVTVQAEILDLLRSLQAELGMAMILVTHDLGVVADICDRAVVMYAGQVVEEGTVDQIFTAALHPYTRALLRSTPEREATAGPLPAIEGTVPLPRDWPTGCRFAARCAYATEACSAAPVPMLVRDPAPGGPRAARCIRADSWKAVDHERAAGAV